MKNALTVTASANIALVKYWGKRDFESNLPDTGSISVGLENLKTTTRIEVHDAPEDHITINGETNNDATRKAQQFINYCRTRLAFQACFDVNTTNNFPTGAGLASSASGFAALTIAINEIMSLKLSPTRLSQIARVGSGSAARSIFSGFVELLPTNDAHAVQLHSETHWPLSVVVAVIDEGQKEIGSSAAMVTTKDTSPFYPEWVSRHSTDMDRARSAIRQRDFAALASVAESNCLKMHALMLTSVPALIYWQPATLAVMREVRQMRSTGTPVFFSIDAGPQVKVFCPPEFESTVAQLIGAIPGVLRTISTPIGGAPELLTQ